MPGKTKNWMEGLLKGFIKWGKTMCCAREGEKILRVGISQQSSIWFGLTNTLCLGENKINWKCEDIWYKLCQVLKETICISLHKKMYNPLSNPLQLCPGPIRSCTVVVVGRCTKLSCDSVSYTFPENLCITKGGSYSKPSHIPLLALFYVHDF